MWNISMVLNSCIIYYKILYIILTVLEQKVYFSATGTTLKAHLMTSRGPVLNAILQCINKIMKIFKYYKYKVVISLVRKCLLWSCTTQHWLISRGPQLMAQVHIAFGTGNCTAVKLVIIGGHIFSWMLWVVAFTIFFGPKKYMFWWLLTNAKLTGFMCLRNCLNKKTNEISWPRMYVISQYAKVS